VKLIPPADIIKTKFTPEELREWHQKVKDWVSFDLWKTSDRLSGIQRMQQYRDLIWKSAQENNIDPYWFMGLLLVESNGDPNAKPDEEKNSSALGIAQFTEDTAKENGLIGYGYIEKIVPKTIPAKGKRKAQTKSYKVKVWGIIRDDRLKPEAAIPAAARLLARYVREFQDVHFAALAYHSGRQAALNVREYFGNPNLHQYLQLFFSVHPVRDRSCYHYLFNLPDFAPAYPFRVERAAELLRQYDGEKGKRILETLAKEYQLPGFGTIRNRFWLWYPKVGTFGSVVHIKKAVEAGFLVDLGKKDYPGFFLQTTEVNNIPFIGDFHPKDQERPVFASIKPEAAGMLLLFGGLLTAVQGGQEKQWKARVTSLVSYKLDSKIENRRWPLHANGLAVDIWQAETLTEDQIDVLRFVIWRMNLWGFISHDKEDKKIDKDTTIVLRWYLVPNPNPEYQKIFIDINNQVHQKIPGPDEARVRTVQVQGGS
jgi:hypothetical protein